MRAVTAPSSEPRQKAPPAVVPLCLSVEESASAIGIGRTRMWDLVRSGRVPAVRINHRVLIRMDDLERFVDSLVPIGEPDARIESAKDPRLAGGDGDQAAGQRLSPRR